MVDSTNLSEVDINQIATDLNGKMDRDCLNASDTGNIQMAHNAMPSDKYIELDMTASPFTAPADGYYCINGMDNGVNNTYRFVLRNQTRYFGTSGYTTGVTAAWCNGGIMAAKKGDVVYLYTANIDSTTHKFRFYYAVGAESEAS